MYEKTVRDSHGMQCYLTSVVQRQQQKPVFKLLKYVCRDFTGMDCILLSVNRFAAKLTKA